LARVRAIAVDLVEPDALQRIQHYSDAAPGWHRRPGNAVDLPFDVRYVLRTMTLLRRIFALLFRRRTKWSALDYGKAATVEDEWQHLNGER